MNLSAIQKAVVRDIQICMGVKHGAFFRDKNINYNCLKGQCPGKYSDLRRLKKVINLGYFITRNFVI
jgi:hypothetical protein